MQKPILYFDMDGTLVNFQSGIDRLDEQTRQKYEGHLDDVPGIFALMDPMDDAIEAVHTLAQRYDVYILSTAPWDNPTAWCDKLKWVKKHFGGGEDSIFYKRLILSHHKDLCKGKGAYLIDDRDKWGASEFKERHIKIGSDKYPNWKAVVAHLMGV